MTTSNLSTVVLYKEDQIGRAINLYYPPIIIFFGTIGNVLSILIYTQAKHRKLSAPSFIVAMAIIDNLMLYVGLLQYWVLFNFAAAKLTEAHCKGMFFVVNFVGNYSHWIIVLLTIDRFIAVYFPIRSYNLRTRRRAVIAILALGLTALFKNLHYLWTTDFYFNKTTNIASCAFGLKNKSRWVSIYQAFEVIISSIIPFAIILVLNLLIVYRISIKKRKVHAKQNQQLQQQRQQQQRNNITITSNDNSNDKKSSNKRSVIGNKQFLDRVLTKVLVFVSFVFIATTCPLLVFRLYYANENITGNLQRQATYNMWHHIWHKLWYTNHSINFFLYSILSKSFRDDLKKLFSTFYSSIRNARARSN